MHLAQERYRFGVTEDGKVFAVSKDRAHLARYLTSGRHSLRDELANAYYCAESRPPSASALEDATAVLRGAAQTKDPETLHLRIAEQDNAIWIDVGDEIGRVIHLTAQGWKAVDSDVPVIFRRTQLTSPAPLPVRDASLDPLWELTSIPEQDRPLVKGWLVAALAAPGIPHPILAIFGEHGSGKSTVCQLLVQLLDPSPVPLRQPHSDPAAWVTAAAGSYAIALDNLSEVKPWLSNSLCRAVTGDGDVRRTLFKDSDLTLFGFRRVMLLNGIDVGRCAVTSRTAC